MCALLTLFLSSSVHKRPRFGLKILKSPPQTPLCSRTNVSDRQKPAEELDNKHDVETYTEGSTQGDQAPARRGRHQMTDCHRLTCIPLPSIFFQNLTLEHIHNVIIRSQVRTSVNSGRLSELRTQVQSWRKRHRSP